LILDLGHGAADAETMRVAGEYARLLGLDLHCLFIEDEALLAMAALPFAREIRLPTHTWSPLDADTITRELHGAATQAQHLLDEILPSVGVSGRFQVLRGDPATCISTVCRTGDIIIVSQPAHSVARGARGVTRLHAAAHASAASVLLLPARHKPRRGRVAAVLADAQDESLAAACGIAVAADEGIIVLLPEPISNAAADSVRERARALGISHERVTVRPLRSARADDVLLALDRLHESLIVLRRAASDKDAEFASRISAMRGVAVLLIESRLNLPIAECADEDP
jgi:hypothetical protein